MQNDPSLAEKLGLGSAGVFGPLILLFVLFAVVIWMLAPFMLYGIYHRLGQIRDLMRRGAALSITTPGPAPRPAAAAAAPQAQPSPQVQPVARSTPAAGAQAQPSPQAQPVARSTFAAPAFSITGAPVDRGERLIMPAGPSRLDPTLIAVIGLLVLVVGMVVYFIAAR